MRRSVFLVTLLASGVFLPAVVRADAAAADALKALEISAEQLVADRNTGAFMATGNVKVVARPLTLVSEHVCRSADGTFRFSDPTAVTTCTNAWEHLHWKLSGSVVYRDHHSVMVRNAWLSLYGFPVVWLPFWYYPMDTNYGFHFMPGYSKRWGAYLLMEYVYGLYQSEDGQLAVRGRTRLDVREENGVAVGQDLSWRLRDWGEGAFHVYYASDDDYDRYRRYATSSRWRYDNWESEVERDRYRLEFAHRCELTERDVAWADLNYVSDSAFKRDFIRPGLLTFDPRFRGGSVSRVAWEHVERLFGLSLTAETPLNEFDGGVSRLPEFCVSVNPLKLPGLPVDYESQTRLGYYRRDYGLIGRASSALPFRYRPGPWADYDAFRADTYHRLTLPMKFAEVLSVVPRVGYHGTFWNDSGYPVLDGRAHAGATGDDVYRSILEGGVTLSARGVGTFDGGWSHIVEPYLDVLVQEADFSGLDRGHRPYVFDSIDGSFEWLDQFAGRSRNLPYSYSGVTPGVRNVLKGTDESGELRTILDFDCYCAIQFNDTDYTAGNRYHRLSRDPADPNYGDEHGLFLPGARLLWNPEKDWRLAARAEYDPQANTLAESQLLVSQRLGAGFTWSCSYIERDHRRWDYASTAYDPLVLRDETFNRAKYRLCEFSFVHELCDAIVWSPYLYWDCVDNELDEVGMWVDYRTDCLGFRLLVAREFGYDRVDYSHDEDDTRVSFLIYLRAFGPGVGTPTRL